MKRPWIWTAISTGLVGVLALTWLDPHRMVSPGPLLSAHADLSANCAACHAPFQGAVAERCLNCHAVAEIGLKPTTAKTAFHQALTTQDCLACHHEHQTTVSHPTFAHALLEPGIRGNCVSCHTAPSTPMHQNAGVNCAQCHTPERWKPATFDHGRFFTFDANHQVACAICHVGNDYRTYTCYGCHEHQPEPIRAKHLKEGISDFQNCVHCHRNAQDEPDEGKDKDD